ncbi:DUF2938 domain-containing protein [Maricaulis sp.]|uniref:DUF2938 domain-containing protein n=1 Tax=Maricaulis sp. TaxID=1486257 RepID=UPI003299ECAC
MSDPAIDFLIAAVLIGCGATAVMDVWGVVKARLWGVASLDYALLGRWIGHMPRGRFAHRSIAAAVPVAGERALGWLVHYLTGIAFAALLLAVRGLGWLDAPTLAPALTIGLGTVLFPFLVMQPALGAGFAASRTPAPGRARFHSLVTHAVFGLGLYLSGLLVSSLLP